MRFAAAALILLGAAVAAFAEPPLTFPYRGEQIRGLSEREILDLREGLGMGLARAAELNGYPGPRHLLETGAAGQLHMSPEQLDMVRQLFETMSREARRLGDMILREEQALEAAFRAGAISEADLQARVERLAALSGELRLVHLRTHLQGRALLTDHQVQRYNQVRGYEAGPAEHAH